MQMRRTAQKGFTLIELIITIVIIGVLAAVAIPKFQDLTTDANVGVASGVGAAIASASSVNYARKNVPGAQACTSANTPAGCYWTLANCTDFTAAVLATMIDSPAATVTGGALNQAGATATCTVTVGGGSKTFNAYGA